MDGSFRKRNMPEEGTPDPGGHRAGRGAPTDLSRTLLLTSALTQSRTFRNPRSIEWSTISGKILAEPGVAPSRWLLPRVTKRLDRSLAPTGCIHHDGDRRFLTNCCPAAARSPSNENVRLLTRTSLMRSSNPVESRVGYTRAASPQFLRFAYVTT